MSYPLIVLAGGSTKANTDERTYLRHRSGLELGEKDWRGSLRFDGRHFLDTALDIYRVAGYDPITVLGDPGLDEIIENEAGAAVLMSETTLGEKLLMTGDVAAPGEIVTVVAKDIVPEPDQLQEYMAAVERRMDAAAVVPMVDGRLLVERGFRNHIRHKTYVARAREGVDVLAFPQIYSFRPDMVNLSVLRYAADLFFPFRGNGINLELVATGLSKLLFNSDLRNDVGVRTFFRSMGIGLRARYARHAGRGTPGISIPSYDEAIDALSPVLREPDRAHELIAILPGMQWDSLAMDFDDPREAGMVAGYRGLRHGYTDAE